LGICDIRYLILVTRIYFEYFTGYPAGLIDEFEMLPGLRPAAVAPPDRIYPEPGCALKTSAVD